MQKNIPMDSETLLRKVFSRFVHSGTEENILSPDSNAAMFLWPWKFHNAFVFYPGNPIMPLIIQ